MKLKSQFEKWESQSLINSKRSFFAQRVVYYSQWIISGELDNQDCIKAAVTLDITLSLPFKSFYDITGLLFWLDIIEMNGRIHRWLSRNWKRRLDRFKKITPLVRDCYYRIWTRSLMPRQSTTFCYSFLLYLSWNMTI